MATMIFDNAYLLLNSVDLSDHVKSLTINYDADQQDDTAMGDNTKSVKGGLKNWSASVEFHQDFATGKVDPTLFSAVGTTVPVVMRPDTGSISATNPSFSGNVHVGGYGPLNGAVGDMMGTSIELTASKGTGNADLTRATS